MVLAVSDKPDPKQQVKTKINRLVASMYHLENLQSAKEFNTF